MPLYLSSISTLVASTVSKYFNTSSLKLSLLSFLMDKIIYCFISCPRFCCLTILSHLEHQCCIQVWVLSNSFLLLKTSSTTFLKKWKSKTFKCKFWIGNSSRRERNELKYCSLKSREETRSSEIMLQIIVRKFFFWWIERDFCLC